MDIDQASNVEELRGRCLEHSRRAYRLLPPLEQSRILDIGCGQGQQTMELSALPRWVEHS
jgi:2-polyprenyl-3-methyl-5-hydroxy-6-metoxy-1,4-benzoquinol methylase